ncbi:MAG: Ig-like domain-containing protein, partial [Bacteroidales bacterium]|nr:Ig-like domain-containing protein [Bacteroidales bacterium]
MKNFLHALIFLLFLLPFWATAQCPAGEAEIIITITTDEYGSETTWALTNAADDTIVTGGPYADDIVETYVIDTCVLLGEELTFTIEDAYGDGICAGYGDGWYSVEMFDFVFAQGCDFEKGESTTFTVETPPDVNAVLDKLGVPFFVSAGEIEIEGEISNKGVNTITSIDINWTINNGTVNTQNVTGLNMASHETSEFTHDITWNASDLLSTNDLEVWLSNPNGTVDDVPDNDTISFKVFILDQVSEKRAIIEHFTNASCAPCASQNPALDALLKEKLNEWEVTHIAYHTSWPGTDPMYSFNLDNDLDNARVSYYGVGGVPNAVLSGNKFQGSPANVTQSMIDTDWLRPGLFDITADLTYANDSVYADIELISLADFSAGEIVVHVVLVEDLEYSSPPGSNGEAEFPDVMRYMFPDVDGTNIGLPVFDEIVDLSFKHKMDSEVSEEMQLVVFVQNNNDKDIYGVYQLITDFTAPLVTFNIYNGEENVPVDDDILVNIDMSVRYSGGEVLTDADTLVFLRTDSTDGEEVIMSTTISDSKKIITINPDDNMEAQSTYFVGLKSGLEGFNGTSVAEKFISFETGWGVG